MTARPAIIHLIGFPACGKYTVARALAERADGLLQLVVVDNHMTANVIFAVLDVDGVRDLPAGTWARVDDVRAAVYRTIRELSPRAWSFVFTNVLTEGEPKDRDIVGTIADLAQARGSVYAPVRLHCEPDELVRRVGNAERRARSKWVDAEGLHRLVTSKTLVTIEDHPVLDLDVTSTPPERSAQAILDHVRALTG